MRRIPAILVLAAVLLLSGCASRGLYDWGSYEASIERMYLRPERFNVANEITRLSAEVRETAAEGLHVPPGKYAHLGYLHYMSGDQAGAVRYFEAEKRAFPESAVFIDGMLGRMQ